MAAEVQSLRVHVPLFGTVATTDALSLHCGSLIGTGSLTVPDFHVVSNIRRVPGSYKLDCFNVWGWSKFAAEYRRKHRRDPAYEDAASVAQLTLGLDNSKELFVTEIPSLVNLHDVTCLAVLYDCGVFKHMTRNVSPRPYMFWSLMQVDSDGDLITLTPDESVVYKYSWLNSQIHQAADAEVRCCGILIQVFTKHARHSGTCDCHRRHDCQEGEDVARFACAPEVRQDDER
jgi:hypothetical protein